MREVVGTAGWAVTVNDIYTGGKLINEVFPEPAAVKSKEELENEAPAFDLTKNQLDVVKKAIKFNIEKGQLFPTKYVSSILEKLGLVE